MRAGIEVAAWGARGQGPGQVFRGEGIHPKRPGGAGPPPLPEPPTPPLVPPSFSQGHSWLTWLVLVLQTVVVLTVLWILVRVLVTAMREWTFRRRPRKEAEPEVEFDLLEHPDVLADDLATGAEHHQALLAGGSPRNGIVACWHEFEQTAARRGLARKPWQTSSEFTLQILDLVSADGGAVGRLAGLYREARFSDHEVTEADRSRARHELDTILGSLAGRRIGGGR